MRINSPKRSVLVFLCLFLFFTLCHSQEFRGIKIPTTRELAQYESNLRIRGEEYIKAREIASETQVKGGIQETFLGFCFGMTKAEVEAHILDLVRDGKLNSDRKYTVNYVPSFPLKREVRSVKCDLFFDYYSGRLYKVGLIAEQNAQVPQLDWTSVIDEVLGKKGFERFDYGWGTRDSQGTSYLKDNMDVSISLKEHYSKTENKRRRKSRIDEPPTIESVTIKLTYTDLYVVGLIRKSKEEPIRKQLESTKSDF